MFKEFKVLLFESECCSEGVRVEAFVRASEGTDIQHLGVEAIDFVLHSQLMLKHEQAFFPTFHGVL